MIKNTYRVWRSLLPTTTAMSKICGLHNSSLFFSAFQRYVSLAAASKGHIHTPSLHLIQSPQHLRIASPFSRATYASTCAGYTPEQQKPDTPILYDLFPATLPKGPPPHGPFIVNTQHLKREFLQLQARAHPDRHTGANKAKAEGTSALINEAYKTLQDPLRRAQYLLSLRGIDVAEDERLKVEDPELLMEVLEVREAIEAAQEETELEDMKKNNDANIERSEEVLDEAFRQDNVQRAMDEAVKLRYWINIKESLDGWERGKPIVLVH